MSQVNDFGAAGDGQMDDTEALQHAAMDGDGVLEFEPGVYRITKTIEIPLSKLGPLGIRGSSGTARIVMAGPGPAFRLVGTHSGTGDPTSRNPQVIENERLPTFQNIEITGDHAEADGIELVGTMQSVFEGVLIHGVRHGIRLFRRNRNVLISHSHIYNNRGIGIFLDQVNLHQINIIGCHISYNRLGGIRIEGSEIRNLQITGNDIEYNAHHVHGTDPETTAEIYVDTTAEGSSVAEVTIASNTIQGNASVGGTNIRILDTPGKARRPELWTITGNIIGSQENNVHLTGCHGVVISGNFIYSAIERNLLIERCSQMNIGGNSFRRHGDTRMTGLRLVDSQDCLIHGCQVQDEAPEGQTTGYSLIELDHCRRINITGCQLLDGVPYGIDVADSSLVNINVCTVSDTRSDRRSQGSIRFTGNGQSNLIANCTLGPALKAPLQLDEAAHVQQSSNILAEEA